MSACRGETAELDLTGTLTLNFLAWIEFLRDILGLSWWFFPTWGINLQRQIPNGIPAFLRGEVRRSTAQLYPFNCISRVNPELCFAMLPLGHLSSSIPAGLLHAWEVFWPILPTWSTLFSLSDQFYQLPYWFDSSLCCPCWEECCSADHSGRFPIPGFRITLLRECPSVSPAASSILASKAHCRQYSYSMQRRQCISIGCWKRN